MDSDDAFVVIKNTTTTGKSTYNIYRRPDGETSYSELIARSYSPFWAEHITMLLNSVVE